MRSAQQQGHPVISLDTKNRELVGAFKNGGREWRTKGEPEQVNVHDFVIAEQGTAIRYGVCDLSRDEGWVSVGVDHDTAHFAVNAICSWWNRMGCSAYGGTGQLVITADAGGSNSPRTWLWKWEMQRFANRTGLSITVCPYPPGSSKRNRIEHRLFSYIAMNWRGKPLVSLAIVVNLIGATTHGMAGVVVRTKLRVTLRKLTQVGHWPTNMQSSLSGTMPRATIVSQRGFDFAYAIRAFLDPARIVGKDRRWDYGEDRYRLLGAIESRVFVVIYAMRGAAIQIISARKANRREVREYEQNTRED